MPALPPVAMRLLLQPEHAYQADRHFQATRAALRYYGEWYGAVSVRQHHDRRSGLAERCRRHGIPDALHRRHALARAAARRRARGRHRPRSRPPVLVRHRRHQRVRARVDGRGHQHLLDRARRSISSSGRSHYAKRYFGGFIPWVFDDLPLQPRHRRQLPRRLPDQPVPRRGVAADLAVLAGRRVGHHLHQDGAVAAHARAHARLGDAAEDPVDLLRALRVQAPAAARLLRRRQRGQRPRPDVVLRSGLPQLGDVRLRGRVVRQRADRRSRVLRRSDGAKGATELSVERLSHVGRRPRGRPTACSRSTCG